MTPHAAIAQPAASGDSTRRQVLAFGVTMAVVFNTLLCIWGWEDRNELLAATHQRLLALGQLHAAGIGRSLDTLDTILTELRDFGFERQGIDMRRLALTKKALTRHMLHLARLDENGRIVYWTGGPFGADLDERAFVGEHRDKPNLGLLIGNPRFAKSGTWLFEVSRRIDKPNGEFGGVIVAFLDIAYLAQNLETLADLPGSTAALLHENGRFLARVPDPGNIAERMSPTMVAIGPKIESLRLAENRSPIDGLWRLAAYVRVASHPLVLAETAPKDAILRQWWEDMIWPFLSAMIVNLGIAAGTWRLIRTSAASAEAARISEDNRRRAAAQLAFQRALLNAVPVPMVLSSGDGHLIQCNNAFLRWFDLPIAEILGKTVEEVLPVRLAATWKARGEVTSGSESALPFGAEWTAANGTLRNAMVYRLTHSGPEGTDHVTITVFIDVTDQRRQEEKLRQSEARFRFVAESIPVGLAIADWREGKLIFANPAMAEMFDTTVRDLSGASAVELYADPTSRARLMALVAKDGMAHNQEIEFKSRAGRTFWGLTSVTKGLLEGREVIESTTANISEKKAAEDEIRRSNAELDQFASVVSHDLRSPLNVIVGYMDLLERQFGSSLDPKAIDYIATAREAGTRMARTMADLLDYARVGRKRKPFEPVDANEVLRIVLGDLAAAIQERRGNVIVADHLPVVSGDLDELIRVFQNLIQNGLKYHRPGILPQVEVSAETIGAEAVFQVKDNGIGIRPEHYDRAFRIFQRLHTDGGYEGTGIGLAVCKKIVERHHGRIWIESVLGEGTRFFVALPRTGA